MGERDTEEDSSREGLNSRMNGPGDSSEKGDSENFSSSNTLERKHSRPLVRRASEQDLRGLESGKKLINLAKAESREIYRRPSDLDHNLSESSLQDSEELEGKYSETFQGESEQLKNTDSREQDSQGVPK